LETFKESAIGNSALPLLLAKTNEAKHRNTMKIKGTIFYLSISRNKWILVNIEEI
jgi:hypothetical protein